MANQIIFSATITPANTAMEVTINGGTSFAPLAFTTVGSVQQGTLTGVPAATYAAGQLILRAVGYPATAAPSTGSVIVAAAATLASQASSAFITAAGLTVQAHKDAVTQLCVDLSAAGLLAAGKGYAYWPIVGGNATAHGVNLLNVNAFPLSFVAAAVHDANGFTNGGSIALTGFVGSRDWVGSTLALAYYSRTLNTDTWDMGVADSGTTVQGMIIQRSTGLSASDIGDDNSLVSHTETDSRGFFVASRTSLTANALYKNGTLVASGTTATPSPIGRSVAQYGVSGVSSNLTANYVNGKQCAGAGIFNGLLASEVSALYAAIQKFNTSLGRQV